MGISGAIMKLMKDLGAIVVAALLLFVFVANFPEREPQITQSAPEPPRSLSMPSPSSSIDSGLAHGPNAEELEAKGQAELAAAEAQRRAREDAEKQRLADQEAAKSRRTKQVEEARQKAQNVAEARAMLEQARARAAAQRDLQQSQVDAQLRLQQEESESQRVFQQEQAEAQKSLQQAQSAAQTTPQITQSITSVPVLGNVAQGVDQQSVAEAQSKYQSARAESQPQRQATVPPNPTIGCINALLSQADFAPISSKIYLGFGKDQPFAMTTNTDKPTDEEKKAIASWMSARQECFNSGNPWRQQYLPPEINAIGNRVWSSFLLLTADLYNGKITYGDYAKQRSQIIVEEEQDYATVWPQLNKQNKNRTRLYQSPAPSYTSEPVYIPPVQPPTTTNCYIIDNYITCRSR